MELYRSPSLHWKTSLPLFARTFRETEKERRNRIRGDQIFSDATDTHYDEDLREIRSPLGIFVRDLHLHVEYDVDGDTPPLGSLERKNMFQSQIDTTIDNLETISRSLNSLRSLTVSGDAAMQFLIPHFGTLSNFCSKVESLTLRAGADYRLGVENMTEMNVVVIAPLLLACQDLKRLTLHNFLLWDEAGIETTDLSHSEHRDSIDPRAGIWQMKRGPSPSYRLESLSLARVTWTQGFDKSGEVMTQPASSSRFTQTICPYLKILSVSPNVPLRNLLPTTNGLQELSIVYMYKSSSDFKSISFIGKTLETLKLFSVLNLVPLNCLIQMVEGEDTEEEEEGLGKLEVLKTVNIQLGFGFLVDDDSRGDWDQTQRVAATLREFKTRFARCGIEMTWSDRN